MNWTAPPSEGIAAHWLKANSMSWSAMRSAATFQERFWQRCFDRHRWSGRRAHWIYDANQVLADDAFRHRAHWPVHLWRIDDTPRGRRHVGEFYPNPETKPD